MKKHIKLLLLAVAVIGISVSLNTAYENYKKQQLMDSLRNVQVHHMIPNKLHYGVCNPLTAMQHRYSGNVLR